MLRLHSLLSLGVLILAVLAKGAVTPAPSSSPSATPKASETALIETLPPGDLQEVVPLLKSNFINPDALNDLEVNRATVQGLLLRLGHGVMLLADHTSAPMEMPSPFYSEIFSGHIGYLRAGALSNANLQAVDAALKNFASQKVDALIIDLRASPPTNNFANAAEFSKRFVPKGVTLFNLRKPATKQEQTFVSDRDPTFQGMNMVLIDGDTAGAAEVIAGVLHQYDKSMLIGASTAGRAVQYSDLALKSGKILRVAVAEAGVPGMKPLYPDGLTPDLAVEMAAGDKRDIFQQSLTQGMSRFVFENERPHLNEAALLAGRNPELDAAQKRSGGAAANASMHDAVVQRAVDLITSLAVYQNR